MLRTLAKNLGIRFETVPIGNIFDSYLKSLKPVFDGPEADVTEENIQARIRGALVMAMSNKFGALVLTTGNKSEIGVGYCTLYGDMCGGLAVISDVPKTLVYRLARYVNYALAGHSRFDHREEPLPRNCGLGRKTATRYHLTKFSMPFWKTMWKTIISGGDCGRARLRSRAGAQSCSHGGHKRIQAAASRSWLEDFRKGLWLWTPLSDRGQDGDVKHYTAHVKLHHFVLAHSKGNMNRCMSYS